MNNYLSYLRIFLVLIVSNFIYNFSYSQGQFTSLKKLNYNVSSIAVIPQPTKIKLEQSKIFRFSKFDFTKSLFTKLPNLNQSKYLQLLNDLNSGFSESKFIKEKICFIKIEFLPLIVNDGFYKISISENGIVINCISEKGLFYAWQTLKQLIINPTLLEDNINYYGLPICEIEDQPKYSWRGLMLDVSRHFFNKKDVFKFIDNMALFKFNLLHMHLTDDEGWRIEIKSLPKLTEIGAFRPQRIGKWGNTAKQLPYEKNNYGGFYTQLEMKEIIDYAKERFIDILPEVDIPGHSMAMLAAYPELSCTPDFYRAHIGNPFIDWSKPHLFAFTDNTLCPTNPLVYDYLDKIFSEIATLFPFPYIHIGGDECAKNFWEENKSIQQLMKDNNYKNIEEVQNYFTLKVKNIIESKHKKVIGWDEILEANNDTSIAIMSWRGEKGGIEATKRGHKIVMSPTTYTYLDYYQGEKLAEPPVYAGLRLKKCYQFNPCPSGVDCNLVLGGQGNVWTEQLQNNRSLEYMVWPRALAISEALWSENKDWNNFTKKLELKFFTFLDNQSINFSTAIYDPIITAQKSGDSLFMIMEPEIDNENLYYTIYIFIID